MCMPDDHCWSPGDAGPTSRSRPAASAPASHGAVVTTAHGWRALVRTGCVRRIFWGDTAAPGRPPRNCYLDNGRMLPPPLPMHVPPPPPGKFGIEQSYLYLTPDFTTTRRPTVRSSIPPMQRQGFLEVSNASVTPTFLSSPRNM